MNEKNYFQLLNNINVNEHKEPKGNLMYLSWVWAWGEVKKLFPDAFYTVYENKDGWNYHTDGRTCWVKTGVTINGLEHIEFLPVMNYQNKSIPFDKVTSFDVNTAIQRSITKACARHGLGLYIYAGEDLPEVESVSKDDKKESEKAVCADCGKEIIPLTKTDGTVWKVDEIVRYCGKKYGRTLCEKCGKAENTRQYDGINDNK